MPDIHKYDHPFVCTDAVVFRISTQEADSYRKLPEPKLSIMLYTRPTEPYKDKCCLPGGFINIDETPEDCIKRKLAEKVQLENCYLEQLYTFCDIQRDTRARVISIAYLGLLPEVDTQQGDWYTVLEDSAGQLTFKTDARLLTQEDIGFDHYLIIQKALERLRAKLSYSDIVFNLLPEEFTLTQLQNVYEAVTGKKELTANFRRKMGNMVIQGNRFTSAKGHRPAQLFTKNVNVKETKY